MGISVDLDLIDDLQPPDPTDVLAADCERVLVKGENDEPTWPELYVLASTDDALVVADPTLGCACTGKLTLTSANGAPSRDAPASQLPGPSAYRSPWRRVHH